jgi:hypothetical protein
MDILRLVMPLKVHAAAPNLREVDAAGNISNVNVRQQLLGEVAGGDRLSEVRLPDVPLPAVHLPDVPLLDVPLLDVALPEARLDGLVGEE